MTSLARYRYLFLGVFFAGLGAVFWFGNDPELEFRPHPRLEGFRELVFDGRYSKFDPLFTLVAPTASTGPSLGAGDFCKLLLRDPASPHRGSQNAKISLVEFFDYRCPYCRRFDVFLGELLADDPRLRRVYKDWPILGTGSVLAARAALAAARQGKYFDMHDKLLIASFAPSMGYIDTIARNLGLDAPRLRKDMSLPEIKSAVDRTAALASRLGFRGTPSLVIGRTVVRGAITRGQLKKLVALELASPAGPPCR